MPRFRSSRIIRAVLFGGFIALGTLVVTSSPSLAKGDTKKEAKKAKKEKAPPPKKKVAPPNEAHKKKLAELYSGFKFGMSKDEVVALFSKQLNERYDEKLKATTDVAAQDRIRKERKAEIARLSASYVMFEPNKPSPWDVSIVEEEHAHGTEESMLERWENQGGKNQRRFFYFYQGKLWKMFISLDVSILPEDKKNFQTFQGVMTAQYGPGDIEPGLITWTTNEFVVRAVDKLKSYDALALVIEDPRVKKDVLALREAKAPPKKETSAIIKAVIDPENKDKPDVKANSNAVDTVIKAQNK